MRSGGLKSWDLAELWRALQSNTTLTDLALGGHGLSESACDSGRGLAAHPLVSDWGRDVPVPCELFRSRPRSSRASAVLCSFQTFGVIPDAAKRACVGTCVLPPRWSVRFLDDALERNALLPELHRNLRLAVPKGPRTVPAVESPHSSESDVDRSPSRRSPGHSVQF